MSPRNEHGHKNKPLTDAISGVSSGAYSTVPYLLLSFSSSPPLHQEIVALGEAWGRHSKTTSPPLWITVDFFTGRRVKSGGEAEEQTCVKAICFPFLSFPAAVHQPKCQVHH